MTAAPGGDSPSTRTERRCLGSVVVAGARAAVRAGLWRRSRRGPSSGVNTYTTDQQTTGRRLGRERQLRRRLGQLRQDGEQSRASSASASDAAGARAGSGVPGQHVHHDLPGQPRRRRRTRAATSSSSGRATRTASDSASSASASTPRARRWGRVPGQHATPPATRATRPSPRTRAATSSSSGTSDGQDGSGTGVFGQRFDAAGARLGAEFRVNTYTTGDQAIPLRRLGRERKLRRGLGEPRPGRRATTGVFGQRFDAAGTPLGAEFRVNTYTTIDQTSSAPSPRTPTRQLRRGLAGHGQDGSLYGIFGQRFGAAGAPLGASSGSTRTPRASSSIPRRLGRERQLRRGLESDPGRQQRRRLRPALQRRGHSLGGRVPRSTPTRPAPAAPALVASDAPATSSWPGRAIRTAAVTASSSSASAGSGRPRWPWTRWPSNAATACWSRARSRRAAFLANINGAAQAFGGAFSSITGPAGATYTIVESRHDYGDGGRRRHPGLLATATASSVSPAPTRPAPHWDASVLETIAPGAHGPDEEMERCTSATASPTCRRPAPSTASSRRCCTTA